MSSDHSRAVSEIASQLTGLSRRGKRPRVYRSGSNSTRPASYAETELVDLSVLNRVLSVDEDRREALVEPNVSMERVIAATLEHGYLPPVVMEFPGITPGAELPVEPARVPRSSTGCFTAAPWSTRWCWAMVSS